MRPEDENRCEVCGAPVQDRNIFCRRCGTANEAATPRPRTILTALAAGLLLFAGFLTGILLPVRSGLFPFVVFGLVLVSCALPALRMSGAVPGTGRRRLLRALDGVRIRPMALPPSLNTRIRIPLGR